MSAYISKESKGKLIRIARQMWYMSEKDIEYMKKDTTTYSMCQQRMIQRRRES